MIPTAEKFLNNQEIYDLNEINLWQCKKVMIEFAKLHVEAALKEAKNLLKDGYVTAQDEEEILNAYSLENIK